MVIQILDTVDVAAHITAADRLAELLIAALIPEIPVVAA